MCRVEGDLRRRGPLASCGTTVWVVKRGGTILYQRNYKFNQGHVDDKRKRRELDKWGSCLGKRGKLFKKNEEGRVF